jgi:hypothetical protein
MDTKLWRKDGVGAGAGAGAGAAAGIAGKSKCRLDAFTLPAATPPNAKPMGGRRWSLAGIVPANDALGKPLPAPAQCGGGVAHWEFHHRQLPAD